MAEPSQAKPALPPAVPQTSRPRWRLKLRGKFILLISAILILVFGIMAYLLVNNARNNLTNELNNETKAFAALATKPIGDNYELYHNSGTLLVKQQMQKFAALNSNVSNIAVVNLQGLSQFSLTGGSIDVPAADLASFNATTRKNDKGQIVLAVQPYIDDKGQHSYAIAYEISPKLINQNISRQEATVVTLMMVGLILSAIATYGFIDIFFLRPINSLSRSAQVIAQGKYDNSITEQRSDEIGSLAASINDMANALKLNIAKLRELDVQKDEFIKIVSHNLRTPLTIIQSNAAFLDSSQLTPILKKMVQGIEDSARRLNLFSEQILTITDFESGRGVDSMRTTTSLNEMLGGLSREYSDMAKGKNVMFKSNIQGGDIKFLSSQFLIAQAVRNLLDNAMKFTPEQGTIELNADILDKIHIIIKDTGIGIKPQEMSKLFTKFHRASDTLVYNYEGTGIGLYVTKLIVDGQGGSIKAESKLGEGSTFTIELPFVAPTQAPQETQLTAN
jgi:signal transduction histidine kinase